jgi:putative FmdB family regulatory protein
MNLIAILRMWTKIMPIYEYRCSGCGAEFERLTPLANAHTVQECPHCGKVSGERILSVTSVGGGHAYGSGSSCSVGGGGFG